ncbi:hypothetical protein ACX80E_06320 [Arthrobacter sp. TMN-49]
MLISIAIGILSKLGSPILKVSFEDFSWSTTIQRDTDVSHLPPHRAKSIETTRRIARGFRDFQNIRLCNLVSADCHRRTESNPPTVHTYEEPSYAILFELTSGLRTDKVARQTETSERRKQYGQYAEPHLEDIQHFLRGDAGGGILDMDRPPQSRVDAAYFWNGDSVGMGYAFQRHLDTSRWAYLTSERFLPASQWCLRF